MDEDAKTLLAILALIYGSSQGIGLFRTALDSVQKNLDELQKVRGDSRAAVDYVKGKRKTLWLSLWTPAVLFYVVLVLTPALFLALVVSVGADAALSVLGLQGATDGSTSPNNSPFYWILLLLSLVSATQLLSAYLRGWGSVVGSLFPKKE
ncbi:MAG TPA: hypothetical protein VF266_03130 [Thermoanaerobaculia bacterium]